MKIHSMYSVHIKHYNRIFDSSVRLYREAVDYLIRVCDERWDDISALPDMFTRKPFIDGLIHKTEDNPSPAYGFDGLFYKFPSYLRRDAIAEAVGKVSSYHSNLMNWEAADPETRGSRPGFPKAGFIYPCMTVPGHTRPGSRSSSAIHGTG